MPANIDTTTQSLMTSLHAMAPKIEMPEVINKWTHYYGNPTDYKSLCSATYASFLSPFESLPEFAGQVLATAAISTSISLATMVLAAASAYFLFQTVKSLISTPPEGQENQTLNQFKLCGMTAISAYLVSMVSPFIMPALMASLALRSGASLYENRSEITGFFKANPSEAPVGVASATGLAL
jgi:hypothetical protein